MGLENKMQEAQQRREEREQRKTKLQEEKEQYRIACEKRLQEIRERTEEVERERERKNRPSPQKVAEDKMDELLNWLLENPFTHPDYETKIAEYHAAEAKIKIATQEGFMSSLSHGIVEVSTISLQS